MCIICKDLENLTTEEAMRNIGEALISTNDKEKIKHLIDLSDRVMDKDIPMPESNPDLDENWMKENRE